ncbi:N-acetylmuramoyl-L-alanine amidase family protein [Gracilibacillus saliphilus]|uniref:N-acetylmuramoyl-L-alanine amidase family protein n=1 Tax=Gracilibacillus saliphilus TaxID=543890 RepID=UPI0013D0A883|nr:N-acetylmuramoyl-L-alanine amidase [Gracilibacillus saliphilus]
MKRLVFVLSITLFLGITSTLYAETTNEEEVLIETEEENIEANEKDSIKEPEEDKTEGNVDEQSKEQDVKRELEESEKSLLEKEVSEGEEQTSLQTMQISSSLTADELYEQAKNERSATSKVKLFEQGYQQYPNDGRFEQGLQDSVLNLLGWASRKQNNGEYEIAKDRYQTILGTNGVKSDIIELTKKYLEQANALNKIPLQSNLENKIQQETTVSGIFDAYLEAYKWYPYDDQILNGFFKSQKALFNWAKNQHDKARYETAESRYNKLLAAPILNKEIEDQVKQRLADTQSGKRPSDVIYEMVEQERTVTGKVRLNVEGLDFYPDDVRFQRGLQTSVENLLNWASNKQNNSHFRTAIDRYLFILEIEGISPELQIKTEKFLQLAENEKFIPKADDLYDNARKQTTASGLMDSYQEAYVWYPEDSRIVNGFLASQENLFDWAKNKHDQGDYSTALTRYEKILNASLVNDNIIKQVKQRLDDAKVGKRSPDVIYKAAKNASTASGILDLYLEGYKFYPNDQRFVNGMQEGADGLYEWTTNQHNKSNYEVATARYLKLLEVPNISDRLRDKISLQLNYSEDNKSIPTPSQMIENALHQNTLSQKLEELVRAYYYFDESNTAIEVAINDVVSSYLSWATDKQSEGEYQTAIARYEKILETPAIEDKYIREAETKLKYAKENKKIPTANEMLHYAEQQTTASGILNAYLEAFAFYPENNQVIEGITYGASNLLSWASSQHNNGNYTTAIDRYEKLLKVPRLDTMILKEIDIKLAYAKKSNRIPSADYLLKEAEAKTTASGIFDAYEAGAILYPNDSRINAGLNSSALNLYSWATAQHEARKFDVAISRYNKITESPFVSNDIKDMAKENNSLAKQSKVPENTVKIFLDPGHGGSDPGGSGYGLEEKKVVLKIANYTKQYLEKNYQGIEVKLSRSVDTFVGLEARSQLANNWRADYFVSFHTNAFDGNASGFESYVHNGNVSSLTKNLQKEIHTYLVGEMGFKDRGMKQANFSVLRNTNMPAILMEYLFIDNKSDNKLLSSEAYLKKIGETTAKAVASSFHLVSK